MLMVALYSHHAHPRHLPDLMDLWPRILSSLLKPARDKSAMTKHYCTTERLSVALLEPYTACLCISQSECH